MHGPPLSLRRWLAISTVTVLVLALTTLTTSSTAVAAAKRPSVAGKPAVGKVLTCRTGSSTVHKIRWTRNGRVIQGAKGAKYRAAKQDRGKNVRCAVRRAGSQRMVSSAPVVVTSAPSNTAAPLITGNPKVGKRLTCNEGTWTGDPTFRYSWTRDGSPIVGETSRRYTVMSGDEGSKIVCLVQGRNAAGASGYLQSESVTVAGGSGGTSGGAPTNTDLPYITGTPKEDKVLTCREGTWTGNPTFAYSWTRNGSPIVGATDRKYTVTLADTGTQLVCLVQGSNASGASGYRQSASVSVSPAVHRIGYDSTPTPLPGNVDSYNFPSINYNEWGDAIRLAGGGGHLDNLTVTMSSWSCETGRYNGTGANVCHTSPGASYQHDVTVNLYEIDASTATGVGALIGSFTVNQTIPYRPSASAACGGKAWEDEDGNCFNGKLVNLDFDTQGVRVPSAFIASIAYNTRSSGYNPTGVAGPADTLNVAIAQNGPSVGTDVDPDVVYRSAGSPGGIPNAFEPDSGWGGWTLPFRMNVH